jgi:hypothetical protein
MSIKQFMKATRVSIFIFLGALFFDTSAFAQEINARELLGRMDAEIASFESFVLKGDAYADARMPAGQIIEHSSEVIARVQRPGKMRITKQDAENLVDIFFSGGLLTVYNTQDNFFAQTQIPEGIDSAADFALNRVGLDLPFLDFVSKKLSGQLTEGAQDVQHLGKSLIRGKIYEHIGVRTPEVDIQLWIASEGRPLPGKMAISSKWENGNPRFVAFLHWDAGVEIPDSEFKFEQPENAVQIEFILEPEQ